jgi:hypothetical protein
MKNRQRLRIWKIGFQPGSARRHLACDSTGKMPVVRDSHDGYPPQKETK